MTSSLAYDVWLPKHCSLSSCLMHKLEPSRFAVGAAGRITSLLVFVGRNPGEVEVRRDMPFVGRAGHRFDQMLDTIGVDRSKCFVTNLVKCFTPGNMVPPKEVVACCAERYLQQELEACKHARMIVTLGREAERWVAQSGWVAKQLALVHPSAALRLPMFEARLRSQTKLLALRLKQLDLYELVAARR